jgi:hypothetical protein
MEPIDRLQQDIEEIKPYLVGAAQPAAKWRCDLGHLHSRPERLNLRALAEQAEISWRAANPGKPSLSGATWHLAVKSLIDEGVFTNAWMDPNFEFDLTGEA